MGDSDIERAKRMDEQRRQQEMSKNLTNPQTAGYPTPPQPKKNDISVAKYVIPIIALLIIGLIVYKYNDDILRKVRSIIKGIEKRLPQDFQTYVACLIGKVPWEQCMSGTPPQPIGEYNDISIALGDEKGDLRKLIREEDYYITATIKNIGSKDIKIKDVSGKINCKVREKDGDIDETISLLPINAGSSSFGAFFAFDSELFGPGEKLQTTLKTQTPLTCSLDQCDSLDIDVNYPTSTEINAYFRVGVNKKIATESSGKVETKPGSVEIILTFEPYDYYYIGRDMNEMRVLIDIKNKGEGKASLEKIKFEKIGDTSGFFSLKNCDCGKMLTDLKDNGAIKDVVFELKKDETKSCFCYYNIGDPKNLLTGAPFKTIIFNLILNYTFSKEASRQVNLEGDKCTYQTGNGGSTDTSDYCSYDQQAMEDKLMEVGSNLGINCPSNILYGIAVTEEGLKHCNSTGQVKRGESDEIGLMQIKPGLCPDKNLYDVFQNIECAGRVLKQKYDYFYPTDQSNNRYDPNSYAYDRYGCGYSYTDPCKRAVRGYNGWGCPSGYPRTKQYVCLVYDAASIPISQSECPS